MHRQGKRYYLEYETSTPAAQTAEPALVAANEAAGASPDGDLFDPFLEDFEPELKERVQRQLDQEAALDSMPEITDESALERLLDVPVQQQPQPKAQPILPDALEQELHCLTRTPYAPWCEHCVAAKAREDKHIRKDSEQKAASTRRVVQGDYCFYSRNGERVATTDPEGNVDEHSKLCTVLCAVELESQTPFVCYVPRKGTDKYVIWMLVQFVKRLRHKVVFQVDQENPIIAVFL